MLAHPAVGAADPTDVIGRRIGAGLIDSGLSTVLLLLILLLGSFHLFDRIPTESSRAAADTCDAFNQVGDPGEPVPRRTVPGSNHTNVDTFCIPSGRDTIYVRMPDLFAAYVKVFLLSTVLGMLNPIVLQAITGGSVGKLLLGLRVVREDGGRPAFGWHALRWVFLSFEAGLLGLLLVCLTRGHRRLGDMVASTYVVDRHAVGTPVVLPAKPGAPVGWYAPPPAPDGPHWDPARDAYIQYDRHRSEWLQWNEQNQRWGPIDR